MKLIRLNSFLYLFCILSVFASCVQKPDSSVEDWNRTFINTKKLISEACLDRELILGRPFLIPISLICFSRNVIVFSMVFLHLGSCNGSSCMALRCVLLSSPRL